MTNHIARIISVTVLGTVLTGCATVPGDPYYQPQPSYQVYEQPGYIYSAPPVYSSQPVYRAPPAVYYGGRDNRDDRWDNNRDRDRAERDRNARDRADRDRADRDRRDQQARDAANRDRARDQARREQAERDRRAAEDRRNREQRPGRLAPDSYTPHPNDWRSRQFENSGEKP